MPLTLPVPLIRPINRVDNGIDINKILSAPIPSASSFALRETGPEEIDKYNLLWIKVSTECINKNKIK